MNNRLILLISGALIALSLVSLSATAGSLHCASPLDGGFPLIRFNASNGIKLSSSQPIGQRVFHQSYTVYVWCSISDPLQQEDEIAFFTRRTNAHTLGNGLTLFTTLNGDRGSDYSTISTGVMITNRSAAAGLPPRTWQFFSLSITVEIVKTGETPTRPEMVTPINSHLTLFHIGSEAGHNNAEYLMLGAETGIIFIAQSCQIHGPASFNVPLGRVRTRRDQGLGSGMGSTSAGKTFALNFRCDVDVTGNFSVLVQLDGALPAGTRNRSLLALSEESGVARGVALQILHATHGTPVEMGQPWQIARYPLTDRVITVPLQVRYYQIAERITPGKANGTMTWTLHYL